MNAASTVALVARREITTRIRSRAFLITTAVLLMAIVAGAFALSAVGQDDPDPVAVGVEPGPASLALAVGQAAATTGLDVTVVEADRDSGRAQVDTAALAAYVTVDDGTVDVLVPSGVDPALAPVFAALAQQVALDDAVTSLGGDPAEVRSTVLQAEPVYTSLRDAPSGVDTGQSIVGMIAGILIFMGIMLTGQMVAQGVVEEKSSRVIEVLLATIRPWQLIAGKVLGIGALGLAQIALYVAASAGSAAAFGLLDGMQVRLGPAAFSIIGWFVIGYLMFALILGALSSLVSRQEDVGSVITPVIALLIVPYVIGVSVAPWDPHSPLVTWMSYVPLFSPMLMPIRSALGVVEPWEVAVTVAASVVLIVALVGLAGTVYSRAVLRTGGKVSLREAMRRQDS